MIKLYINVKIIRAVKMGWNSRANSAHHGFGLGWNFFTNFNMDWFL